MNVTYDGYYTDPVLKIEFHENSLVREAFFHEQEGYCDFNTPNNEEASEIYRTVAKKIHTLIWQHRATMLAMFGLGSLFTLMTAGGTAIFGVYCIERFALRYIILTSQSRALLSLIAAAIGAAGLAASLTMGLKSWVEEQKLIGFYNRLFTHDWEIIQQQYYPYLDSSQIVQLEKKA